MANDQKKFTIIVNLMTGTFFFLLGLIWPKLRYISKPLVRWFFGKGVFSQQFYLIHGSIIDSRVATARPDEARFIKRFHDGRTVGVVGPWGNIVGDSELRATSYIINSIDLYRDSPIGLLDDREAFKNLESTFISLGSPSSNEITDLAMRDSANVFLEFGQDSEGNFIKDKKSEEIFRGFERRENKDLGVVLKIPNTRFPGHFFFVCAGLGSWGTSGATWYLGKKWRKLPWTKNGFGIIVEVDSNSDTSARKIHEVI